MASVKYHGEFPEGRDYIVQHGVTFDRDGKAVSVSDKESLARFASNRFFEVTGESDKEAVEQGKEEAEKAEIQGIRSRLEADGIRPHHLLKLPALQKLEADHLALKSKANEG